MLVPAHVFREYDIRGVADRELSSDLIRATGEAFAAAVIEQAPKGKTLSIAVGRDCRLSSSRLFDALSDGLTRAGVNVVDIGIGPTPLLYFAVHHLDADGGVMITGSHNPGQDNGFKIMSGKASFFGSAIQKLRALVEGDALPDVPGGSLHSEPVDDAYVARLSA